MYIVVKNINSQVTFFKFVWPVDNKLLRMNGSTEDHTADLWLRIDQLHLNYLKSENNTKKLDIRKKLEGKLHGSIC